MGTKIDGLQILRRKVEMFIRVRTAPRKFDKVWVTYQRCPMYDCFHYGLEHHTSAAGYSGCSAWTGTQLVCKTNEVRGCPDVKVAATPRRMRKVRGAWEWWRRPEHYE